MYTLGEVKNRTGPHLSHTPKRINATTVSRQGKAPRVKVTLNCPLVIQSDKSKTNTADPAYHSESRVPIRRAEGETAFVTPAVSNAFLLLSQQTHEYAPFG